MGLSTGSAYLDVVPKLVAGFGKILGDDVNPEMEKAGKEGGNKFSKSIGAAGIGAGAILGKGVYDGLDISAANDKLAAQLDLSTQAADVAGKAAANIYKGNWGDSIEDVDNSIAAVGSSLLDLNKTSSPEIEAITEKALNLATAFEVDVPRSANSAGILIKTGLAKNATEAFDLITRALQGVPAQVREDILDASDEYSTYFKGLGFTGAQAFQLLKNASAGGAIQIDKAGDAIKEFTIRSTDMSTTSVDAYKALGLDAKTMSDTILKGGDSAKGAFDKIVNGLIAIKDPTLQSNTAIGLFGTQFEDIGVKNIPAFLQGLKGLGSGMTDVDGAADRFGKTLNDNAKSNVEGMIRTLKTDLVQTIGGVVIPKLDEYSSAISTKLGGSTDTVKNIVIGAVGLMAAAVAINMGLIAGGWVAAGAAAAWNGVKMVFAFTQIIAAALEAGITFASTAAIYIWNWTMIGVVAARNAAMVVAGWVSSGVAALAAGVEQAIVFAIQIGNWTLLGIVAVRGGLEVAAGWVMTGASAVAAGVVAAAGFAVQVGGWILLGAESLLGAAKVAAAWLIALGPIGIVIAAVIAVVALIIANWDTVSRVTGELWNGVKAGASAAWDWIKNAVSTALNFLVFLFLNFTGPGLLIKHWNDIKVGAGVAFDWIHDKVVGFINFFGDLPGQLRAKASGLFDGIKDAFKSALNWIIDKWNGLELKLPEIDTHIPGIGKVGGFTLGTPDIPRFASGGLATGTFIAGEHGAEIVQTQGRAHVYNAAETDNMMSRTVTEKHYHYHNESKLADPLVDQFREMERLLLPI